MTFLNRFLLSSCWKISDRSKNDLDVMKTEIFMAYNQSNKCS